MMDNEAALQIQCYEIGLQNGDPWSKIARSWNTGSLLFCVGS